MFWDRLSDKPSPHLAAVLVVHDTGNEIENRSLLSLPPGLPSILPIEPGSKGKVLSAHELLRLLFDGVAVAHNTLPPVPPHQIVLDGLRVHQGATVCRRRLRVSGEENRKLNQLVADLSVDKQMRQTTSLHFSSEPCYQVSMYERFFSVRGGTGGRRLSPLAIHDRVSAGSITSSTP